MQEGFAIQLTTQFEVDGEIQSIETQAVAVESVMTFDDFGNSDYSLVGEIEGGNIVVKRDDRVLDTWPQWAGPPKREDLRNCIVTLQAATVGGAVAPDNHEASTAQANTRANPWGLPDEPLLGFIEIPSGVFTMGSSIHDPGGSAKDRPQHMVTLPMYFIGKYEVTVAQCAAFVKDTGHEADRVPLKAPADHPVWNVSWYDAIAYCDWLTGRLRDWTGASRGAVH